MDLLNQYLLPFLLLFCRSISFFMLSPVFSQRQIPVQAKVGLAVAVSLTVTPLLPLEQAPRLDFSFLFLVVKEILVGLVLGFAASLIFLAVQMAGTYIDMQIGFAMANLVDPQTGMQMPLLTNFKYTVAFLFFLAIDGHHQLIHGLLLSTNVIPVMTYPNFPAGDVANWFVSLFQKVVVMSLQMAAPMFGAIFLMDLALGIIARTVPQMNIFVIGFPLKIFGGLLFLLMVLPSFFAFLIFLFREVFRSLDELIRFLGMV